MISEVELFVCDDCELILLGGIEKTETPICMQCEKEMTLATFTRWKSDKYPEHDKTCSIHVGYGLCNCGVNMRTHTPS